jgi:hypothetical protein
MRSFHFLVLCVIVAPSPVSAEFIRPLVPVVPFGTRELFEPRPRIDDFDGRPVVRALTREEARRWKQILEEEDRDRSRRRERSRQAIWSEISDSRELVARALGPKNRKGVTPETALESRSELATVSD